MSCLIDGTLHFSHNLPPKGLPWHAIALITFLDLGLLLKHAENRDARGQHYEAPPKPASLNCLGVLHTILETGHR